MFKSTLISLLLFLLFPLQAMADIFRHYTHVLCVPEVNFLKIEAVEIRVGSDEEEDFLRDNRTKRDKDFYYKLEFKEDGKELKASRILTPYIAEYGQLYKKYNLSHLSDETKECVLADKTVLKYQIKYKATRWDQSAKLKLWENGKIVVDLEYFNDFTFAGGKRHQNDRVFHEDKYHVLTYKSSEYKGEPSIYLIGHDYTGKKYLQIKKPKDQILSEAYLRKIKETP